MLISALLVSALQVAEATADTPQRSWRSGGPPPRELPSTAPAQAGRAGLDWLVGARPGLLADQIAARYDAERLSARGIYLVDRRQARRLASAFRAAGVYRFSEANARLSRSQAPSGGDDVAATDWRGAINPPATPASGSPPLTAVIDDAPDPTHPDLAGGPLQLAGVTVAEHWHGTAVTSLITGRANAIGMVGVFPDTPVLAFGTTFTIADTIRCVAAAVEAGARIINMSYGHPGYTYAEHLELAYAVSQGVLPVAAAGNDRFTMLPDGTVNPVQFPAALPHVLSVAAVGPHGASSEFSTSNGAVDLSAPGEAVLAAVPVHMDADGVPDGYSRVDGTSFAAPIVAGAAAWLLAARPGLQPVQAADLLRITARNVGRPGWDADSGFGLIDLSAAVASEDPFVDPGEVNDDIAWVNGTRFTQPDDFVFGSRQRRVRIDATVDLWKDPADVYRIQVPARRRLLVTVDPPRYADPDLALYSTRSRSIYRRRGRIGLSVRPAGKLDRLVVPASRRRRTVYAAVYHPGEDADYIDAPYRITIARR